MPKKSPRMRPRMAFWTVCGWVWTASVVLPTEAFWFKVKRLGAQVLALLQEGRVQLGLILDGQQLLGGPGRARAGVVALLVPRWRPPTRSSPASPASRDRLGLLQLPDLTADLVFRLR